MVVTKWQQVDVDGCAKDYNIPYPYDIKFVQSKDEVKELKRLGHLIFTFSLKVLKKKA